MSYNGAGAYYALQPQGGMGAYIMGVGAISDEFSAADAWSKWLACSAAWQASQAVVPECKVVDLIRAGLGELGYGPLGMGASWGSADQAQMRRLATDHGLDPGSGLPTQNLLQLMESLLKAGQTPGGTPTHYTKVGTTYVTTGDKGAAQAAMTGGMWLLVVAAVGGVAYLGAKAIKKRRGARPKPAAMAPGTRAMVLR